MPEPVSAINNRWVMLSAEEWEDLAVMVGVYLAIREQRLLSGDLGTEGREAIERRCRMARLIREAVTDV